MWAHNNTSWGFLELTLGKKHISYFSEMKLGNIMIFGVLDSKSVEDTRLIEKSGCMQRTKGKDPGNFQVL